MKYQYQITTGDRGGDGHNQSDTFIFNTNHSNEDIRKAYEQTCIKTKIYLTQTNRKGCHTILAEYEENKISSDDLETLIENGVNLDQLDADNDDPDGFEVWGGENVFHLFMAFAKASLPDLEYEIVSPEYLIYEQIGYGAYQM